MAFNAISYFVSLLRLLLCQDNTPVAGPKLTACPQSLHVERGTEWSRAPHPQPALAECVPMSPSQMWNLYHQRGEYRLAMPLCGKGGDRRQGQGNGAEGAACVVSNVSVSWPVARRACKAVWGSCGEKPQVSLSNQSRLCSKSVKATPSLRQKTMPTVLSLQSPVGIQTGTGQSEALGNHISAFSKHCARHLCGNVLRTHFQTPSSTKSPV